MRPRDLRSVGGRSNARTANEPVSGTRRAHQPNGKTGGKTLSEQTTQFMKQNPVLGRGVSVLASLLPSLGVIYGGYQVGRFAWETARGFFDPKKQAENAYAKGTEALNKGDYVTAAREFEKASRKQMEVERSRFEQANKDRMGAEFSRYQQMLGQYSALNNNPMLNPAHLDSPQSQAFRRHQDLADAKYDERLKRMGDYALNNSILSKNFDYGAAATKSMLDAYLDNRRNSMVGVTQMAQMRY